MTIQASPKKMQWFLELSHVVQNKHVPDDSDNSADLIKLVEELVTEPPKSNFKSRDAVLISMLKRIPLISGLINSLQNSSSSLAQVSQAVCQSTNIDLNFWSFLSGLRIFSWFFSLLNLFRIPLIIMASWVLRYPKVITLSRLGRFTFSALLVSLGLVAIFVPVVAPYISLAAGVLGTLYAGAIVMKVLVSNRRAQKALELLAPKIAAMKEEYERKQLDCMKSLLAFELSPDDTHKQMLMHHRDQLAIIKYDYEALLTEQNKHQSILDRKGWNRISDKLFSFGMASLVLVGLAVGFWFPVVGYGILAGVASATGSYILGTKVLWPLAKYVGRKFSKWRQSKQPVEEIEDLVDQLESKGSYQFLKKLIDDMPEIKDHVIGKVKGNDATEEPTEYAVLHSLITHSLFDQKATNETVVSTPEEKKASSSP